MIPRGQQFSLEAAAEGLIQMWKEFTPEPAQRKEQATKIREWCVQAEEKMVAEALERGMERNMDQTAGGSLVPGAGAWLPQGARPQAFVRTDTNEEYERVLRKNETWQMAVELAEMQQQMAGKSIGRAGPPQQQEEQRAAKAVEQLDNEAVVEAAVSAITRALQQHIISPGGQPRIPEQPKNTLALPTTAEQAKQGQAAFAHMNLAAVLRSAGSHFAKHAPSSIMASGVRPTHAPVSGLASRDPRIAYVAEAHATVEARTMAEVGATEALIPSSAAALSTEARRQLLVMLRGEVADKRAADEVAAQEAHTARAAEEARAARAAEEAQAARSAEDAQAARTAEEAQAARAAEAARAAHSAEEAAEEAQAARCGDPGRPRGGGSPGRPRGGGGRCCTRCRGRPR
jgi:hypothetical protein